MKRITPIAAALIAALAFARSAAADDHSFPRGADAPLALGGLVESPGSATLTDLAPRVQTLAEFGAAPIRLDAVSYQPRSRYYPHSQSRPPSLGSQTQIHSGFFDPESKDGPGFVLGMRGGPMIDPHVQLGIGMDWEHRANQVSQAWGTSTGPAGTTITTSRQLSSSSENTFPMMGYLQLSGPNVLLSPYCGVGGGYEFVTLSATDFATGSSFDATYGGWGWQAWGGARIRLSGRTSMLGEVYWNEANPSRDVYDPYYGLTFRESVNLNRIGMRFGLNFSL